MITEDYCSFEVAKLLKEKGFDVPVNYEYHYKITIPQFHRKKHNFNGIEYSNCSSEWYSAPTHQMAMKWLREMHKIQICVEQNPYDAWHYWGFSMSYIDEKINELPNPTQAFIHICPTKIPNNCYKTYEEAVEAALKYTLENLI